MNRSPALVYGLRVSGAFEHNLRDGVLGGVGDGKMRVGCAGFLEQLTHESMQEQERSAGFERRDFDILPTDAAAPSGLQRLERGFFCGEACGIMLRGDDSATLAVSAFGARVHALKEARRALYNFADTADFDDVYSNGNNHG